MRARPDSLSFGMQCYMVALLVALVCATVLVLIKQEWLRSVGFWGAVYLGFTQILWVVPLAMVLHRRGFPKARNGVLILASVLFSFTAVCSAAFHFGWAQIGG